MLRFSWRNKYVAPYYGLIDIRMTYWYIFFFLHVLSIGIALSFVSINREYNFVTRLCISIQEYIYIVMDAAVVLAPRESYKHSRQNASASKKKDDENVRLKMSFSFTFFIGCILTLCFMDCNYYQNYFSQSFSYSVKLTVSLRPSNRIQRDQMILLVM